LNCPRCARQLTGSISQGKYLKYAYYHCSDHKCRSRFRADFLNNCYEEKLKNIYFRSEVCELFSLVLEDENIFTCRREHADERKKILNDISKQEHHISKTRKYLLDDKLEFDDFKELKKKHNDVLNQLNIQLNTVTQKLTDYDLNNNFWPDINSSVFRSFKEQNIKGKRDIISLIMPTSINPSSVKINSLKIHDVLSLIVENRE
jgi:site-specific DNA recombinase